MVYKSIKLTLDWLFALLMILIGSWLFVLIFLLILLSGNWPIFVQQRGGYKEKIFWIYKFRTLHMGRPTRIGAILRRTSLDELPQLFNILKGEMSFIGPRPLLPEYIKLYNRRHKKRHDVKPGITGWAQVKGRNNLSWEEQFELDVWYVQNKSFGVDLKILSLTMVKIFKAKKEEVQMRERFTGNENT